MRILVLLGLGLPVAAVAAAVAYGSVSQISQSFKTYRSPVANDLALTADIPARPSEAARDFVLASTEAWDMAPMSMQGARSDDLPAADQVQLAQMVPPAQTDLPALMGQGPRVTLDAMPGDGAADLDFAPELDLAVVTERPVARPVAQSVIRPRVVVSADRSSAEELRARRVTTGQNRKREFRMPWQTGVFQ